MSQELVPLDKVRRDLCMACMQNKSGKMPALDRVLKLCTVPHRRPMMVPKRVAELVLEAVEEDMVICAPPYIPDGVVVPWAYIQELRLMSMARVCLGGDDGLVQQVARAMHVLKPNGHVHELAVVHTGDRGVLKSMSLLCDANGEPCFTSDPSLVTCERCRAAITVRSLQLPALDQTG